MTSVLVLCAFLGLAALGAAVRGGGVEETGVVIFSLSWMASLVVRMLLPGADVGWPLLVIQSGLLVGLVVLAWKSPRPWPIWAAGFQVIAVAAGITFLVRPQVGLAAYLRTVEFAGYGAAAAMALGAWLKGARS